jgi:uncharacterized membrane protein YfcA
MSLAALCAFLALVALGAYVQTLTGFAFGLVVMGGVGITGLLPLPEAAIAVSLLVLVNAAQVLARGWRDVGRRELALMLLGSLPLLPAGYALLEWLADSNLAALQLVLGCAIVLSAFQLITAAGRRATRSGDASFLGFGAVAGLMGGLFSTAGPPVVFHMYRQPFPHARIRETLVSVFAANALLRLGIVAAQGQLTAAPALGALAAAPMVVAATYAARRWPPALSPKGIRRIVFVLLALSGLSLALPALIDLL